jgi:vacuolar-type H+-ATPase subunit H
MTEEIKEARNKAKELLRDYNEPMSSVAYRLLSEEHSMTWHLAIEAVTKHCDLLAQIADLKDQKDELMRELTRVCNRNTMLVSELGDRGRRFSPEQLKSAIVKALYEGEG